MENINSADIKNSGLYIFLEFYLEISIKVIKKWKQKWFFSIFPFFSCADKTHDNRNGTTDHKNTNHKDTMSNNDKFETKKSILILICIFSISLLAMFYVYLKFPELDEWVIAIDMTFKCVIFTHYVVRLIYRLICCF